MPVTTPANPITDTLATNYYHKIQCIQVTVTTDANAANRYAILQLTDPDSNAYVFTADTAITASQTVVVTFLPGGPSSQTANENAISVGLPANLILGGAWSVTMSLTNIQAADQLSSGLILSQRAAHQVP